MPAPAPAPVPPAPVPAPTPAPVPAPTQVDFGAAFGNFRPPSEEKAASVAAVDITRITPAKPKRPEARPAERPPTVTRGSTPAGDARGTRPDGPTAVSRTGGERAGADKAEKPSAKAKAKTPPPPSHPSRIWVQVLTGASREPLPGEWRKLVRDDPEVFRGKKAYVTPWRSNFRLLTGPFESEAAAQAYLNQLRRAGVDAFMWTSAAGQAVDALPAGR